MITPPLDKHTKSGPVFLREKIKGAGNLRSYRPADLADGDVSGDDRAKARLASGAAAWG